MRRLERLREMREDSAETARTKRDVEGIKDEMRRWGAVDTLLDISPPEATGRGM